MADENKFLTIKDGVVKGCDYRATKIAIPEGVTEIGVGAFQRCLSLASITIPNSVTEIGYLAFHECESLADITIPDSVTKIGSAAFAGCQSLADIRFGGTKAQWKAVEKGNGWNNGVPASTVHCTDGETQLTL